jgi:hypothetical protein
MTTGFASTSTSWFHAVGQFRWLRAHVSTFCLGAVLLACANLLSGGSSLWSLTAIGVWILLLFVHLILLAIARLASLLMAEDDEEVVLLPIQEAVIVEPKPDPAATWTPTAPIATTPGQAASPNERDAETIPWSVATDVAQVRRPISGEPSE